MFNNCSNLVNIPDISNWNTNSLKKIKNIFKNCSSLSDLPDISNWNLENVEDKNEIF